MRLKFLLLERRHVATVNLQLWDVPDALPVPVASRVVDPSARSTSCFPGFDHDVRVFPYFLLWPVALKTMKTNETYRFSHTTAMFFARESQVLEALYCPLGAYGLPPKLGSVVGCQWGEEPPTRGWFGVVSSIRRLDRVFWWPR